MSALFNALPGLEVPVGGIKKALHDLWTDPSGAALGADNAKATQVNFVLHLGYQTTADDAAAQFQTAVKFSRRYPCRVVVLCPMRDDEAGTEFRAKIYGECHPGKNKGDLRCCEFVMLTYPMSARQFLESQVSVCLSTDLPLYYWAHRFSSTTRLKDYQYLLQRSKRILIDTAVAPIDAMSYPWPRPEAIRDLAYARLLHVRQSIGQFLSGYTPELLADGFRAIRVSHGEGVVAEAKVLHGWSRERLLSCGVPAGALPVEASLQPGLGECQIELSFEYDNGHAFLWRGDICKGSARFEARFGGESNELNTTLSLLSPEATLAEAMFF